MKNCCFSQKSPEKVDTSLEKSFEKVDDLVEKSLEKVCASVCSILIFSYGHGTIELKEGQGHEYEDI